MLRSILFHLILLTVLFPGPAQTREFVVNQRDPAASDHNPGTEKKPLKTISAAVVRVRAGDKVLIHSGDYRETVIIEKSGTKESPIIIEAAPREMVVIKGSEIIRGWSRDQGSTWKAKLPKLTGRWWNNAEPSVWAPDGIHRVFIQDGILLDAVHLRRATAKDKIEPGSFYHDPTESRIYVWLPDSGDPNSCKVEAAARWTWMRVKGSHVIVRGIDMRHASTLAAGIGPACALEAEDSRVENCSFTWADFGGISMSGKRNSIVNCVIACNGNTGIGGGGEGHLIQGCRVLYNNIDRYDPSWHCGGAKLIPTFNKSRIIGNEFAYNIGPGLWLDGACNDNRIERNYCHDNEGPGIMVEISSGNLVMNNVCVANRNSLFGTFSSPDLEAEKTGVHNRFIGRPLNERTQSTLIYQGGSGGGILISSSPDSRVYNNTCYLNEGGGIIIEGRLRPEAGQPMSTRDCRVLNNISVLNKGPQLILRKNGIDPDTSGNRSDHNLLLAVGGILAKNGWTGETAFSVAEWQRVSGQDAHSREGDPRFAMPNMGDFRLLEGSPALGVGQSLPEVKDDFQRRRRPEGNPSMGAAEKAAMDYPRPGFEKLSTSKP